MVPVFEDLLRDAGEPGAQEPDLPVWQKHEWEIARRIVSWDSSKPRITEPPPKELWRPGPFDRIGRVCRAVVFGKHEDVLCCSR